MAGQRADGRHHPGGQRAQADAHLDQGGSSEAGGEGEGVVEHLAQPGGRHPGIEPAARLPGRSRYDATTAERHQVVIADRDDRRPPVGVGIGEVEVDDLAPLRLDVDRRPERGEQRTGPRPAGHDHDVAADRVTVERRPRPDPRAPAAR